MVKKILVVDDSSTDLLIITKMLSDFEVLTAHNGLEAFRVIDSQPDIHLIILDLNMPLMNGFEVLTKLRLSAKYRHMRVIILTNMDEIENEIRGLELGAVDYIRKPINIKSLKIRIEIHRKLLDMQRQVEMINEQLDEAVAKATNELIVTRDITIQALVGLIEARNFESYNHIMRTKRMVECLCLHLQTKDKFKHVLTTDYINQIVRTSPLHDIGKVAIPDHILLKPGKLTEEEYKLMKRHVEFGVFALKKALPVDEKIPAFIKTALEVVGYHHEKYDGTGYPNHLLGDAIPLPGRIMAIVDVFDALINERVYKKAFSQEQSVAVIRADIGHHFDPDIATGFLEVIDEICEINRLFTQS